MQQTRHHHIGYHRGGGATAKGIGSHTVEGLILPPHPPAYKALRCYMPERACAIDLGGGPINSHRCAARR